MAKTKGSTHHSTDVQGNADEWVARQMRELRQITRRMGKQMDTFAETVNKLREGTSIGGKKLA